jgi:lysophospholipase L1-like esterase
MELEVEGMKKDEINRKGPILYVGVGDSLTAGVGAIWEPGFVQRYQQLARKSLCRYVFLEVFAKPGATSQEILKIMGSPRVKQGIKEASIITLSVGGNDLIQASKVFLEKKDQEILRKALNECKDNVKSIIQKMKELKEDADKPYIIRILDLYNPFPESVLADKWIGIANKHLRGLADENVKIANIHTAFKGNEGEYLSADKVHPNSKGYQVIAEELDRLSYRSIE